MPAGVLGYLVDLLVTEPAIRRARFKSRTGDQDGAILDLKVLINSKGTTPQRLDSLAWVLIKNGELEEALVHSEQAMTLVPKNTRFMATRARALRRLGRFDEALPLAEARYHEKKADTFNAAELCKLLVDLGRGDEALAVYREMEKRLGTIVSKPGQKLPGAIQAYLQAREKLRRSGKTV